MYIKVLFGLHNITKCCFVLWSNERLWVACTLFKVHNVSVFHVTIYVSWPVLAMVVLLFTLIYTRSAIVI